MKKICFLILIVCLLATKAFAEEFLPEYSGAKPVVHIQLQEDNLVKNLDKNSQNPYKKKSLIEDEALVLVDKQTITKPKTDLVYDFDNLEKIIIPIKISKQITSDNVQTGEIITFKTVKDIKVNPKITIPTGTNVVASASYVSPRQIKGEGGILLVENFKIDGFPDLQPQGKIHVYGKNIAMLITGTAKVVNMFTFVGGYPLYMIKGQNAKIGTEQVFEIYLNKQN